MGYENVDLVSASYGTRMALHWAALHPGAVHRSLMIAVNPPGRMVWEPTVFDEQVERLSEACSHDAACSRRTPDLAQSLRERHGRHAASLGVPPHRSRQGPPRRLRHDVRGTPPEFAASAIDAFIAADRGDASGLAALSVMFSLPPFDLTRASIWGDLLAKGLTDFDPERDYLSDMDPPGAVLGSPHSLLFFGAARMAPPLAVAAAARAPLPVESNVETLMVGGSIDLSTPAHYATEELLPALSNGRQVILADYGHLDYYAPPEAFERLVLAFLDRGEADVSLYPARAVVFEPAIDFPLIGKIVVVTVVVVPLLLVLLAAWAVVRWRRRQGGGGSRAS